STPDHSTVFRGAAIKSLDQRYFIVFGACLTQFFIIGLLFSYGLFFKAFETEFGWSRTLLSSCISLAFLVMGILAFFAGGLNDRYGPRVVLSVAGTLCGVGYALLSQVTEPWQLFVLFGMFIGVGMATHDVVTLSTIARWFHQRRGIMTGVVKVGTAVGQITVPPVAAYLIVLFGWRPALIILGLTAVVMLLIAASLLRSPPAPEGAAAQAASSGLSFEEARSSSLLWMLCAIQFSFFPTLTTVPLHIVVHAMDLGMTPATAAILLSVIGASSVVGRLTFGGLADRIGGKRALLLCFIPLLFSLAAFLLIQTPWMLFAAVGLYGFAHGGLFTAVSPTVAEYFGLKAHGAIFGLILLFGTIGGSLGPILAGWAFDVSGSYTMAFSSLAGLLVFGLLLVLRLPAAPASGPS
ncbi:MAG: MFS transporter, partial [Pseudomonadota bacterium]